MVAGLDVLLECPAPSREGVGLACVNAVLTAHSSRGTRGNRVFHDNKNVLSQFSKYGTEPHLHLPVAQGPAEVSIHI